MVSSPVKEPQRLSAYQKLGEPGTDSLSQGQKETAPLTP